MHKGNLEEFTIIVAMWLPSCVEKGKRVDGRQV